MSLSEWPRVDLLAFYESEFDESAVVRMRRLVESLADGEWTLGPPEFVDSIDEHGLRTVGCGLQLLAARNDAGEELDRDIDQRLLEEVTMLLEELRLLSSGLEAEIGVELDREAIGWITSGALDRGLSLGLLGEWRRVLDETPPR